MPDFVCFICSLFFTFLSFTSGIYADDAPLYMLIKTGSNSLSDLLACVNDTKQAIAYG